jgi:hypothetical protein
MNRSARALSAGALLALALAGLPPAGTLLAEDEKQIEQARQDILGLAKDLEGGKVAPAKAQAIRIKHEELNHIMTGYKPRAKEGIGVGPPGPGDGIELKLHNLGKRALPKAQLQKEKADLIKVGHINAAIAEVTAAYTPRRNAADWARFSADMKMASLGLVAAAKQGDPAAVRAAAARVNKSCNDCHAAGAAGRFGGLPPPRPANKPIR